jgi:hypothetical protein
MERCGRAVDRHGRIWTATVVRHEEAESEDFRFWFDELTPDQRVAAVADCLASSLKAAGQAGGQIVKCAFAHDRLAFLLLRRAAPLASKKLPVFMRG